MINPWTILGAVLFWVATLAGGYFWGHGAAEDECAAKAGRDALAIEAKEDIRDERIAEIGDETRTAVNTATQETRSSSDEAAERIRTVYVRADCRPVPADIVREHAEARERVNTKLGVSVRPSTPVPTSTRPNN